MTCKFFDYFCKAQVALLDFWSSFAWWTQGLVIIGVLLIIGGMVWNAIGLVRLVLGWVHRLGGWWAIGGAALIALATLLAVFLPKKKVTGNGTEIEDEDPKPVPVPKPKPKKRKTIF